MRSPCSVFWLAWQPVKGTWRAEFKVESIQSWLNRDVVLIPVNLEKKGILTDDCFTLKLSDVELGLRDNNGTNQLSKNINVSLSIRITVILRFEITALVSELKRVIVDDHCRF